MGDYPVGATATSFAVVAALAERETAGVTELATELDRSKGSVHNHLRTLERLGYVVREDAEYRLGLRTLELGTRVRAANDLYAVGRPEVERLADSSGETASLVVPEDGDAVYVFRAGEGAEGDRRDGSRVPLHECAPGTAILANWPRERRETFLADDPAVGGSVDRDLQTVRDQGLAFNRGQYGDDRRSVAAPVVDDDGVAVGAVVVSGPTDRMGGKRLEEDMPGLVLSSANAVTVEYVRD